MSSKKQEKIKYWAKLPFYERNEQGFNRGTRWDGCVDVSEGAL